MMMKTNKKISIKEALELIALKEFSNQYLVSFEGVEQIESLDAILLGSNGVDVPEELIYYDDDSIEDDANFDGEWVAIESDVEEEKKYLKLEMKVSPEISTWLNANKVDLNLLLERLLKNAYETSKMLQK